jgi:transketolase C-terminal domain/subunit
MCAPSTIVSGHRGCVSPACEAEPPAAQIGRSVVRREGKDVALLAYGTVTNDALKAADMLARSGVTATVVDMRCACSHTHHL